MEYPGFPRNIDIVRVSDDSLETAKNLQTFVDELPNDEARAEFTLPVLDVLNSDWEYKNKFIELIGTVIGPDKSNPDENIFHQYILGQTYGFTYLSMKLDDKPTFMITIGLEIVETIDKPSNPLVGALSQKFKYHAPVQENPIFQLAS